jgi:uncharacterized protein
VILVGSGFLIALIDPGDELHARAEAWVGHLNAPLVVTEYVWLEVYNYFSATPMREDADDLLEQMSASADCEFIEVSRDLRDHARQLYRDRCDKRWSLTDCVSICRDATAWNASSIGVRPPLRASWF